MKEMSGAVVRHPAGSWLADDMVFAEPTPDLLDPECAAALEALAGEWREVDWDAEARAVFAGDHEGTGDHEAAARHGFSDRLAAMRPGARLACELEDLGLESADLDSLAVVRSRFTGYDLVNVNLALTRQITHLTALRLTATRLLVEASRPAAQARNADTEWLVRCGTVAPEDIATSELETALGWVKGRAEHMVGLAMELSENLTGTWAAMNTGDLDEGSAHAIAEQVRVLSTKEDRREAEKKILEYVRKGLADGLRRTRRQITDKARREVLKLDPEAASKRHRERVKERGVWLDTRQGESTATVGIHDIAADDAVEIRNVLGALADRAKANGDQRTRDQLQADAAVALLTGRAAVGSENEAGDGADASRLPVPCRTCGNISDAFGAGGKILLVTNIAELLDLAGQAAREPSRLGWIGPVCREVAQRVVRNNVLNPRMRFEVAVTSPETGKLTSLHPIGQRFFRGPVRDAVMALNPECEWPTCSRPATDTEIDHRDDHGDGGETATDNGGPKCRSPHHRYKTRLGWDQIPRPGQPGKTLLVSPFGHTYAAESTPLVEPLGATAPDTHSELEAGHGLDAGSDDEPPF